MNSPISEILFALPLLGGLAVGCLEITPQKSGALKHDGLSDQNEAVIEA